MLHLVSKSRGPILGIEMRKVRVSHYANHTIALLEDLLSEAVKIDEGRNRQIFDH
jgi:hypothetical protein